MEIEIWQSETMRRRRRREPRHPPWKKKKKQIGNGRDLRGGNEIAHDD